MGLRGGSTTCAAASAASPDWFALTEGFFEEFFEKGIMLINYCGGLLLFAGVMIGLLNTLLFLINKAFKTKFSTVMPFTAGGDGKPVQLARVKLQLGSMITLGLTILVASDVLDTLIKPVHKYSMQTLYKLAIVAVIRTGLAYFLGKELEEIKEELEHHDGEKIII